MILTAGVTIEAGQVITRQTLYDLWANAQGGTVETTDLGPAVFPLITGSLPTASASPGTIWYDQTELLWKVWIDVKNDTGVSVWVSWGPDRFDEVFLANEALPPGSVFKLDPTGSGRMVKRVSGFGDGSALGVVGTNATIPSGTWFAGAIEGFVKAWFPYKPLADVSVPLSGAEPNGSVFLISWAPGGLGKSASGNLQNEFIVGAALYIVDPVTTVSNGNHLERILFTGSRYTKR